MEQVVDFFGSDRVLLPGYIPYVETSHMSAPYVVIQIPRDADLESFANDFKGFLVQTFPQLKEEIPEVQNPTLARQEPVGKPSFLEQSWFEEEVNQPLYDSRQLARDENLSQFRKKTNAQQTDPFEANTNSGSWNLSNPLMSLFASRESSPRAKPAEEEPPAPAPVKKDPEDPFAAYFSQESLHIAPPSGEKLEPARIIKQNILDDTNDNPPSAPTTPKEASVSFEPISTKVFSASLVQTFPKAREKPAIQEPGLTPSLITSQRTDIPSSSTDSVSSIVASTPSTAISQTPDATLDLELLYFMQAPWDREPSEPAQPISTTPEPIPEYLKQ